MLACDIVKVRDLAHGEAQIWDDMLMAEPAFASPLLTRDFAAAVAAVRDDVRVAVFAARAAPSAFCRIIAARSVSRVPPGRRSQITVL